MFIATRIVKQVLIIYKSLVFAKHIMLLLTYKSGSHVSKGGFIMKLRKLSAAFIASAVLVMPLGSYMTASAEDAPIVFSTFNISGVTEGSAASPTFTPESDIEVFSIMTYHWNHGSGSPAGTISIYDGEELIGTWEAVGSKGMYNTPDANWTCYPRGLVLKAGHTYKFSDSDPNTWSYNSGSEGCGFVEIRTGSGSTVGVTPSDSQKGEEKTFSSHTYQCFDAPATWDEAKAYCEAHGGHLATITSEDEQIFVEELFQGGTMDVYWLGGTAYERTLEWVTGEKATYENWADGQPDNEYEGYHVAMNRIDVGGVDALMWGDTDSAGTYFGLDKTGFVCEWDKAEETDTLNGHRYEVIKEKMKPLEAKEYCESKGGYLATITSQEEQDFVAALEAKVDAPDFWIGGSDAGSEGEWYWFTGEPWEYTAWYPGGSAGSEEPNNGLGAGEDYILMMQDRNYQWTDAFGGYDSEHTAYFVCEWSEVNASENVPVTAEIIVGNWEIYKVVDESTGNEVESEFKGWIYNFKSDGSISSDNEDTENITWKVVDGKMVCSSEVVLDYDGTDLIEHLEGCDYYFRKIGDINALGDLNSDGKIDAKDASMILVEYSRMSTGEESTLTDAQKSAANINGDDKIDAKDASTILSYYAMASTATGDVPTLKEFAKPKES